MPDGAISEMAARVAAMRPSPDLAIVHLSGALGLDALDALRSSPRGSFHPLQSFPFPRPPDAFRGITVAVDSTSPGLRRTLAALARSLGARPKHVPDAERARYHAAAVFASNFVNAAFAEGARLLEGLGWTRNESVAALLPLLDGAVANIHARGPIEALTGPIRRGDAGTVRRHLEAVDNPDLYRMLALVALRIAAEAGLAPEAVERTKKALS